MNRMIYPISDPLLSTSTLSGGKGCSLCRLSGVSAISVPDGVIVTTKAYQDLIEPVVNPLLEQCKDNDEQMPAIIRSAIRKISLPEYFMTELQESLASFGDEELFAVRSSATAEDLPDASFAGQQDSYLNVKVADIGQTVLDCFASLYNDRAVAYRNKNGYSQQEVQMAVVIQRMVSSQVSGVLFTADPLTSDRYTFVLEAVEGLGEELVSGRKTPYTGKIRQGQLQGDSSIASPLEEARILELVELGQMIQTFFGCPQDIEWCFSDGRFHIVQSRAITTLYPLPGSRDGVKRLFLSAGHMQMMTDTILPLGMSFFRLIALFQTVEVGGRLYIDITQDLKSWYGRKMLHQKIAAMDPAMYQSVQEVLARKEYLSVIPKGRGSFSSYTQWGPMLQEAVKIYRKNDPSIIDNYIRRQKKLLEELQKRLSSLSGKALLQAIINDQEQLSAALYDATGFGMVLVTQFVLRYIDQTGKRLTGEEHLSNRLSKSVEHNITSQMGLALGDVSDLVRSSPGVAKYLEHCGKKFSFEVLQGLDGGPAVAEALSIFLQDYGMRATGEIDISKPRFREEPSQLIVSILTNAKTLPEGHGTAMFRQGEEESAQLIQEILRLAKENLGNRTARKLKRYISLFRNFVGTREYPKYFWICRYDIYKQALNREAEQLVKQGVLQKLEDFYYLYLEEVAALLEKGSVDYGLIEERKRDYRRYALLTPPRLIFSDGEVLLPQRGRHLPEGALAGLGVSGGVVEGRARVIQYLSEAKMETGDILVTAFTDPSWTPAFVSIAGLVTEIGGMMTHGAVITREYGLPAVVGVEGATRKIPDGAWVRLDGDKGYVEILER